jgi:L-glutamine-phosphate cytidylyltransferase
VRGVILAAGRGTRLAPAIGDLPKCLARIGTSTLLERQIRTLQSCGLVHITVVAGYMAEQVEGVRSQNVEVLRNASFATTNSLYSLWLARDVLVDGFVVLNGDVLFHPELLSDLLAARHEDALLVATRAPGTSYSDEEMKVHVRRGIVADIGKTLSDEESDAENIGIAKFGPKGARRLIEHLTRIVNSGSVNEWLPRAFADFCRERPLRALDGRGYPWVEIDFPEDYWRACVEVLPAIEHGFWPAPSCLPSVRKPREAFGRAPSHV